MAVGFTKDGAVQDQIDDTISDAVTAARSALQAETILGGTYYCVECDAVIPAARKKALPHTRHCVACKSKSEISFSSGMNRRACKDALLR